MLADGLQRIGIEEPVPFQGHTADEAVVEGALQHVVILGVAVQEEHPVIDIHVADGGAGLAVGAHVRKLVVLPEGFAAVRSPDAAGDVELLGHDVVPDPVDGVDIALVAGEGGHVGHAGIHVGGADGVSHGLALLQDREMRLVVLIPVLGLTALVQEELGLVQVFLLARGEIQLREGHFGDLVSRNHPGLAGGGAHFADHAVRIADGDVQEIALAGGLPVGDRALHHVAEVVQFVAELLILHPAAVARPLVRMFRIHGPGRVQVTVRLLRRGDDHEDAVDIGLQLLVRIGLEHVGGAFDGLIDVRVVEGIALDLVAEVHGGMHLLLRLHEVLVAAFALALGESQRDRHFPGGLEALSPEGIRRDLHAGEGNRVDGITARSGHGSRLCLQRGGDKKACQEGKNRSSHSANDRVCTKLCVREGNPC